MKTIYLNIALILFTLIANAQISSYSDLGVIFSKEDINGTARFNALSGAFTSLGGDLSAIDINPASAAVFNRSEYGLSLNILNRKNTAKYYGNASYNNNNITEISQAGGVFIFNTYSQSRWDKVALSFTYNNVHNFENYWMAKGNSNYATFTLSKNDYKTKNNKPKDLYTIAQEQKFESATQGKNQKYSFALSGQYNENLYLGLALNTYSLEYQEKILLQEFNKDATNNTLNANLTQGVYNVGNGISFSLGAIFKTENNLRFGLAYQSPTWYNIEEEFIDEDLKISYSNGDNFTNFANGINKYKLKTPGKVSAGASYVFGENGLISLDLTHKNYSSINFSGGDYSKTNTAIKKDLENTLQIKAGGEWRYQGFSVRAGYHYEKSPYKNALTSDDINGFSLGAGYKFRGASFDLAYQKSKNTSPYNFYPQYNNIKPAELTIDNSKFTATLILNL